MVTTTLLDPQTIEHSITAYEDTVGVAEQSVLLSIDGAVPAATIFIPPGVILLANDFIVCGEDPVESRFRLQQSNDAGVTWFDIALARVGVFETNPMDYQTPIRIDGNAGAVLIRILVTTPTGAARVGATVKAGQMTVN